MRINPTQLLAHEHLKKDQLILQIPRATFHHLLQALYYLQVEQQKEMRINSTLLLDHEHLKKDQLILQIPRATFHHLVLKA
jgi:hypothetical protein